LEEGKPWPIGDEVEGFQNAKAVGFEMAGRGLKASRGGGKENLKQNNSLRK
jgi:hypothetical protein